MIKMSDLRKCEETIRNMNPEDRKNVELMVLLDIAYSLRGLMHKLGDAGTSLND